MPSASAGCYGANRPSCLWRISVVWTADTAPAFSSVSSPKICFSEVSLSKNLLSSSFFRYSAKLSIGGHTGSSLACAGILTLFATSDSAADICQLELFLMCLQLNSFDSSPNIIFVFWFCRGRSRDLGCRSDHLFPAVAHAKHPDSSSDFYSNVCMNSQSQPYRWIVWAHIWFLWLFAWRCTILISSTSYDESWPYNSCPIWLSFLSDCWAVYCILASAQLGTCTSRPSPSCSSL